MKKTNNNVGEEEDEWATMEEKSENETKKKKKKKSFPFCFYTECKDAPWSPLTKHPAREGSGFVTICKDEAEATFYA